MVIRGYVSSKTLKKLLVERGLAQENWTDSMFIRKLMEVGQEGWFVKWISDRVEFETLDEIYERQDQSQD